MFQVSEIRGQSGEENKLFLQFWLSLPNNISPNKYFSGRNLNKIGKKQKDWDAKNVQFG